MHCNTLLLFISYGGIITIARVLPLNQGFKLVLISCISYLLMYIILLYSLRNVVVCAYKC